MQILKKLLPGLLPLLVFILVDAIWSPQIGIIVAVIFGIVQLFFIYFKEKRWDKFVILDTALLCAFGIVSLIFDNVIFFKLKPLFINLILAVLIGISAFSKHNIMLKYSERLLGNNVNFDNSVQKNIIVQLRVFFWIIIAHSFLILYSAFFMSQEAWAFISGVLLYIMLGAYLVIQFVWVKIRNRHIEWLPWIDEEGNIIGKVSRNVAHTDKKYLHPVVHTHIINSKNQLYLQKRKHNCQVEPNKWDTAIGGHVSFGETIEQALKREAIEELNFKNFEPKHIAKYVWNNINESEMVFSFLTFYDGNITPNKKHVEDGRFWNVNELKENIGKNVFTPNLEFELPNIIALLERKRN